MDNLTIWDNIIDDRFILDLDEESNHYSWSLNNNANRHSFPYNKKGSHLIWGSGFPLDKVPPNIFNLGNFLLTEIKNVLHLDYSIHKIQLNGQSMGQNGTVHIDSLVNSNERTLMVFINYKWKKEWGGEFQLLKEYSDKSEIIKSIEYISGRVLLFDGSIPHRGLGPLVPNGFRKSLIYRLSKK